MGKPEHHLLYVPGLQDRRPDRRATLRLLPIFWQLCGFRTHIVWPHWENDESFSSKLARIHDKVGKVAARSDHVSIVGQSAGGSAAINAFTERPELFVGCINISGRLRSAGLPTLAEASKDSPAFAQSVGRCEANLQNLSPELTARIMTIQPLHDEVVPADAVPIDGATNLEAPVAGHGRGGAYITTVMAHEWLSFLRFCERQQLP